VCVCVCVCVCMCVCVCIFGYNDGDLLIAPSNLHPSIPQEPTSAKEEREVHALVRDTLNQSNSGLVSLIRISPDFVCLLGPATEGMTYCIDQPFMFKKSAFQ